MWNKIKLEAGILEVNSLNCIVESFCFQWERIKIKPTFLTGQLRGKNRSYLYFNYGSPLLTWLWLLNLKINTLKTIN